MNSGSTRERMLLVCLPAVMIVAVYGWLIYPRQQLEQAEVALRTARAAEPSLMAFAEKKIEVRQLDDQLKAADEANAQLLARRRELLGRGHGGPSLAVIQDLTQQMTVHNLRLLDQGNAGGEEAFLPESLRNAITELTEGSAKRDSVFWRFEFFGRYADVLRLIRQMDRDDHPAIPVQLLMEELAGDSDWRSWSLVVWI
ncbi:MAG: hypothetical protein EA381_09330 [Planctomycetaceae bacterium]|nr:MAG: hypothetical protein EA381_09330 [Planctomycetaceae bacterium]